MYPLIENRQIRVFLSSTFEDMKPERDYLMKNVFPRLRKQAAERDVSLVEIDLRWGITQKQAKRGEVLQICLNEIDNSHPFFIGLLGNRYGSSPDADVLKHHPILKERYPWISDDVAKQLGFTEIEMQYGVLRRDETDLNAYFFIKKDNAAVEPRQGDLRAAVSKNTRYPVDDYTSVEELGEKIEKEFSKLLDRLFPEKNLSQLELERLAQRSFLRSRCHVYVRNEPDFKRLNDFLDDNSRYLVVTGESGMGKSSLIANWLSDHEKDDRYNIIYHFVGNTGGEADHGRILSRLIDEIYDLYNIPRPDDDRLGMVNRRKPEEVLQDLLMQASAMKPLLIVLEGINQLAKSGEESPKLLNWLPSVPIGSKILFSTLSDDETMATFKRRQYPIYKIKALDSKPRRELIVKYLKRYGKELTPAQVARIADDAENKNTLVLRTLLDELLCFGDYQLDGIINYYLSAESIDDFFQRVLQRAERDYGEDLVRDTLSLIAVSYAGMSENELIDMAHILPLQWSAFYCAFAAHFTVKNGLVNFSHRYLSDAVVARYLDCDTELSYRRRVIDYFTNSSAFTNREETSEEHRTWSELAHQYYCAKFNKELHALVLRPEVFEYFYEKNRYLLFTLWQQLRADNLGNYSLADYLNSNVSCEKFKGDESLYIADVGYFCSSYFKEISIAEKAYKKVLEIYRRLALKAPETYESIVANTLNNIGYLHNSQNEIAMAEMEYNESLGIWRSIVLKNPDAECHVANTLNNLGCLHNDLNDYATAEKEFRESLEICRRLALKNPDKYELDVATTLNNLGSLHNDMNDYIMAEKEYKESLEICRRLALKNPDKYEPDLARALNNIAGLHLDMANLILADNGLVDMKEYFIVEKEYQECLDINRRLVLKNPNAYEPYLALTLNNLGNLHSRMGFEKKEIAEKEYYESLDISRRLVLKSPNVYEQDVARTLYNLGLFHRKHDDYISAETELRESLEIYRGIAIKNPDLYESYIANILQDLGYLYATRNDSVREYCRRAGMTYLELPSDQENLEAAEKVYTESLEIYSRLASKNHDRYDSSVDIVKKNLEFVQQKLNELKKHNSSNRPNWLTAYQEQQKQEKENRKGCFKSFFWLLIIGCVLIYGVLQLLAWLTSFL